MPKNKIVPPTAAPFQVAKYAENAFSDVISYLKIRQEEMTKREEIRADRDVALREIKARERVILKYLDNSHKERKQTFKDFFERIDTALEQNNVEALTHLVSGLVEVYKDSPFAALASTEATKKHLLQGDVEVEL